MQEGGSGESGNSYEEEDVAEQNEKALEERGTEGVSLSKQPQIQRRAKMKASKRTTSGDDLKSNLLGGRERAEGGGLEPETLDVDIVTPATRFLRSQAGGSQQTSTRGRGRGKGRAQANLVESNNIPRMATEDGTSEDSSADIGASVDGILQILVRCRALGHAMFRISCLLTWGLEEGVGRGPGICWIHIVAGMSMRHFACLGVSELRYGVKV